MLASEIKNRLRDECSSPFFSLEFYPPMKDQPNNIDDFFATLNHLKQANPLMVDITWSRRNDPGNLSKRNSSSAIAVGTKRIFGPNRTMLHVCCNDHTKTETVRHVEQALGHGIRNIMALRGDDLPEPQRQESPIVKNGHFVLDDRTKFFAGDLVKWVRELERTNQWGPLTVAVAGHMFPPLKTVSYSECMGHLKQKVDAGADFVVTQFFLEVELFEKFLADCRNMGISVPILPGILLFKSAVSLRKMAALANVPIPAHVARTLDTLGADTQAVQNYAVQLSVDMCRHILHNGQAIGIHLFTLNQREMCSKLLKQLGFWPSLNTAETHLNGTQNKDPKMLMNGTLKHGQEGSEEGKVEWKQHQGVEAEIRQTA